MDHLLSGVHPPEGGKYQKEILISAERQTSRIKF
jgi:hypothetical protein